MSAGRSSALPILLMSKQTEETPTTYCLSAYFSPIVEKLLWTTNREDGSSNNLRDAAYEALVEIVKYSPKDCYDTVQETALIILQKLQQVENHIQSQSDRVQFNVLQSLLCVTLQSVLKRMFQSSNNTTSRKVQEDALMAVATMVEMRESYEHCGGVPSQRHSGQVHLLQSVRLDCFPHQQVAEDQPQGVQVHQGAGHLRFGDI